MTVCDPRVAWQAAGLPRARERELGVGLGEGNEPERAPSTTGLQEKRAFASAQDGRQPSEADVIC